MGFRIHLPIYRRPPFTARFKPRNAAILMVRDAFTVSTDEKFSWLSFPIFPDDNTLFKTFFYL